MSGTIFRILPLVLISLFLEGASQPALTQEKFSLSLGVSLESSAGRSSSQSFQILDATMSVLNKEYGISARIEKYSSFQETAKKFKDGEVDSALLWPDQIVELKDFSSDVDLILTYSINGQAAARGCFWTKKGTGYKTIEDLKGKKLAAVEFNAYQLSLIKSHLLKNGIETPLWKFFDSFTRVPGQNSAFMAIAMGDADILWAYDDYETILKSISPNLATQVTPAICSETLLPRAVVLINRKRVSEKEVKRIRDAIGLFLKNMTAMSKKYPEFKAVISYMKIASYKPVIPNKDLYKKQVNFFKDAEKQVWFDEINMITAAASGSQPGKPLKVTPSYDYCVSVCKNEKSSPDCLFKCME